MTLLRGIRLVVLVAAVSACATIPQQELIGYVSAFSKARDAGDTLYRELNRSVALAGAPEGNAAGPDCADTGGLPKCFDPALYLDRAAVPVDPDIRARLDAFAAAVAYNDALSSLATGGAGTRAAGKIAEVGGLLGKVSVVATGAPAAGGLGQLVGATTGAALGDLLRALDTAVSAQAAKETLIAGRPLIDELIDALIADTPAVYRAYSESQKTIASRTAGYPTSPASRAEFERIKVFHKSLQAYVSLLAETKKGIAALALAAERQDTGLPAVSASLDQAIAIRLAAEEFEKQIAKLRN